MVDDVRARDDEQSASAGVGSDRERVAGAHEVVLRHELLDERENFLRRRIGQRHEAEFQQGGLADGVELLDERFEQGEVRGPRAHDDAAGARLGHDGDARLRRARLRRLAGLHRHRHRLLLQQVTEGARHDDGVSILEREDTELGLVAVEVERQLADDVIDVVQLLRRAGENQRVGVLIHRDDNFRRGVCARVRLAIRSGGSGRWRRILQLRSGRGRRGGGLVSFRRINLLHDPHPSAGHLRVNVLEHPRHLVGGHAVERAQAHLQTGVLALLVEARDEILNLWHVPASGDDGEGIVESVGLDDGLLLLLAAVEHRLDLARHVESLGLLQPHELHVALTALRRLVERRQNLLHRAEVSSRAGDDQGVGAFIHRDVGRNETSSARAGLIA